MLNLQTFRKAFETLNIKSEEIIEDYFLRVSIVVKEMIR